MGGWGCPHEWNGVCQRVNQLPCDPGMKGCVLSGRFTFSNPAKNRPVNADALNKAGEKGVPSALKSPRRSRTGSA
jgi:hypothetical protein